MQFVLERLDVTSLPSAFRPKKEKAKKTVLDHTSKGIYVCFAEPGQNGSEAKTQGAFLLKTKDSNALLKGHESFREFAACPVIGVSDSMADSYGGY